MKRKKQVGLTDQSYIKLAKLKIKHEERGNTVSLSALAERLLNRAMAAEEKRLAS